MKVKKVYEKPTASAISFQLKDNLAISEGGQGASIIDPNNPGTGWQSLFDKDAYQIHP